MAPGGEIFIFKIPVVKLGNPDDTGIRNWECDGKLK